MTGGTRKKLKSRPTREFSGRIKDFTSSPLFPERGLIIRGEAGCTRKEGKDHRTNLYSVTNGCFSEGTRMGRGEGRPAGEARSQSHQDTGFSDRSVRR